MTLSLPLFVHLCFCATVRIFIFPIALATQQKNLVEYVHGGKCIEMSN